MPDVFKILKDLELKTVGLDPETKKMQEGYFVSFRTVGLPIHKDDFANPWSPLGVNLEKNIPKIPPANPETAPKTGSSGLDYNAIFSANIAKSQQSYLNTFLLTDDKLRMNSQYAVMPGSSKLSDTWYAIITGANGIPTDSELSPALKKAYDAATAKLMDKDGNPTVAYQNYMMYQDEYNSKVRSWQRAYAAAFSDPMKLQHWPLEGRGYHDDADIAMDRWVGLGKKNEIENALATLAAQGTDPAIALISRAKKRFINSLTEFQSIGQIPYTVMLPRTWYDKNNDDGWFQYTSTDYHTESHYKASQTSYGGGGGFSVGFFSVGGGFSHSENKTALKAETKNMQISFKYCAVDIKRPWLDTSLLNLKNWFLMGDYKAGCISSGKMAQELPKDTHGEHAFLPSIVTSLILVKDLSIKWDNWKSQWDTMSKSTSGSLSVGYGPFAVSGKYSRGKQEANFSADHNGESLKVEGIQLVGYVSTINPFSQSVDSSKYLKTKTPQKTVAAGAKK